MHAKRGYYATGSSAASGPWFSAPAAGPVSSFAVFDPWGDKGRVRAFNPHS